MLSKLFCVSALLVPASAVALTRDTKSHFAEWMTTHQKSYPTEEAAHRFEVFKANVELIESHNSEGHDWAMAMNEYGDLTLEEFNAQYLGYAGNGKVSTSKTPARSSGRVDATNSSIDWVAKGAVTPVKNQGQCGSCWSFSSTGAIEGAYFISTGKLISLSEQELMDCSKAEGNQGCQGGLMEDAFKWVIKNGGIGSEASYPYTTANGDTCKKVPNVASISGYTEVTVGDETALLAAVNTGPVSIAIEADQSGFQFYKSGVFSGTCGKKLDHGVLLVGYGTDSGKDYWKVKNSWGATWGEEGYIRMVRGQDQCGLADAAVSVFTAPTPAPQPTPPTLTRAPTTAAPTSDKCMVDPTVRDVCAAGFFADKDSCLQHACCWSQDPITSIWCYAPNPTFMNSVY